MMIPTNTKRVVVPIPVGAPQFKRVFAVSYREIWSPSKGNTTYEYTVSTEETLVNMALVASVEPRTLYRGVEQRVAAGGTWRDSYGNTLPRWTSEGMQPIDAVAVSRVQVMLLNKCAADIQGIPTYVIFIEEGE
jgi:hypothetical protein